MKMKRKRKNIGPSSLDDSPKRTKVHAQRKFAQGSNVNSPVITPIRELESESPKTDTLPEPVELLPIKRPNTEDFLTFLCFRGTPILPQNLNFFNTASIVDTNGQVHEIKSELSPKNGPIDIAKCGSSSEKPFIAFGVRKRADPIVISRQMDRKRRHALALQALRRKYQEQKMAKIRALTISKLSEKVTNKTLVRTNTVSKTETITKKTNTNTLQKTKVVATKHIKVTTRTTTMRPKMKMKQNMCLRSFRGRFIQQELPFRKKLIRDKSVGRVAPEKKVRVQRKNEGTLNVSKNIDEVKTSKVVPRKIVKKIVSIPAQVGSRFTRSSLTNTKSEIIRKQIKRILIPTTTTIIKTKPRSLRLTTLKKTVISRKKNVPAKVKSKPSTTSHNTSDHLNKTDKSEDASPKKSSPQSRPDVRQMETRNIKQTINKNVESKDSDRRTDIKKDFRKVTDSKEVHTTLDRNRRHLTKSIDKRKEICTSTDIKRKPNMTVAVKKTKVSNVIHTRLNTAKSGQETFKRSSRLLDGKNNMSTTTMALRKVKPKFLKHEEKKPFGLRKRKERLAKNENTSEIEESEDEDDDAEQNVSNEIEKTDKPDNIKRPKRNLENSLKNATKDTTGDKRLLKTREKFNKRSEGENSSNVEKEIDKDAQNLRKPKKAKDMSIDNLQIRRNISITKKANKEIPGKQTEEREEHSDTDEELNHKNTIRNIKKNAEESIMKTEEYFDSDETDKEIDKHINVRRKVLKNRDQTVKKTVEVENISDSDDTVKEIVKNAIRPKTKRKLKKKAEDNFTTDNCNKDSENETNVSKKSVRNVEDESNSDSSVENVTIPKTKNKYIKISYIKDNVTKPDNATKFFNLDSKGTSIKETDEEIVISDTDDTGKEAKQTENIVKSNSNDEIIVLDTDETKNNYENIKNIKQPEKNAKKEEIIISDSEDPKNIDVKDTNIENTITQQKAALKEVENEEIIISDTEDDKNKSKKTNYSPKTTIDTKKAKHISDVTRSNPKKVITNPENPVNTSQEEIVISDTDDGNNEDSNEKITEKDDNNPERSIEKCSTDKIIVDTDEIKNEGRKDSSLKNNDKNKTQEEIIISDTDESKNDEKYKSLEGQETVVNEKTENSVNDAISKKKEDNIEQGMLDEEICILNTDKEDITILNKDTTNKQSEEETNITEKGLTNIHNDNPKPVDSRNNTETTKVVEEISIPTDKQETNSSDLLSGKQSVVNLDNPNNEKLVTQTNEDGDSIKEGNIDNYATNDKSVKGTEEMKELLNEPPINEGSNKITDIESDINNKNSHLAIASVASDPLELDQNIETNDNLPETLVEIYLFENEEEITNSKPLESVQEQELRAVLDTHEESDTVTKKSPKPKRRTECKDLSKTKSNEKEESTPRTQRPSRKTKEAAAIYMEILSHKLVDSKCDDDNVSIDSFPELPNVKKTEQRENELKAKAKTSKDDKDILKVKDEEELRCEAIEALVKLQEYSKSVKVREVKNTQEVQGSEVILESATNDREVENIKTIIEIENVKEINAINVDLATEDEIADNKLKMSKIDNPKGTTKRKSLNDNPEESDEITKPKMRRSEVSKAPENKKEVEETKPRRLTRRSLNATKSDDQDSDESFHIDVKVPRKKKNTRSRVSTRVTKGNRSVNISSSDSDHSTTSDINPNVVTAKGKNKKFTKTKSMKKSDHFSDSDDEPLSKRTARSCESNQKSSAKGEKVKERSGSKDTTKSPSKSKKSPETCKIEPKPKRECAKLPQNYLPMFSSSDEEEIFHGFDEKAEGKSKSFNVACSHAPPLLDLLNKDLGKRFGKEKVNMSNEQIEKWLKDSALAGSCIKRENDEMLKFGEMIPTETNQEMSENIDTEKLKESLLGENQTPSESTKKESTNSTPVKTETFLKTGDSGKPQLDRKLIFRKSKADVSPSPNVSAFSPENESSVYAFGEDNEEVVSTPFRRPSRRPSSTATSKSEDESYKHDEYSKTGQFRKPSIKQETSKCTTKDEQDHNINLEAEDSKQFYVPQKPTKSTLTKVQNKTLFKSKSTDKLPDVDEFKYKVPSSPSASSSSSAKLYKRQPQKQKPKAADFLTPSYVSDFPKSNESAKLVEAPVFHPTDQEFQDPLEYIERIRHKAEQFGICRIVPPSSFKPECKVTDDMRFTAYNQYVNKMLYRWGPNYKELMAIKKYLETQSISLNHPPWIGGMEIDLPRLYQTVQSLGGLKEVIERKKWSKVSELMKIPKSAQDRVTKLDDIYCKYLLPYDTLSPAEREKLFDEVETEWAKKESRLLMRVQEDKTTSTPTTEGDFELQDNDSEECITKGRNMALNAFYRIARNTMSMYFKTSDPSSQEVEQEYWKHVTMRQNHICVHSGSIDCGNWGYGFSVSKNSPFGKHPWNLKMLTINGASVLRSLGPLMGVTVPTLHVGMVFSACCWYRDPHGLPWIEYLHTGGNKIWYGIPNSMGDQFHSSLKQLVPNYCKNKELWLPSDTIMVPPNLLVENNVSLCHTVQEPGQFIVVFPKVFTSSLSTGYVVSESVYFAPIYWLKTARTLFDALRQSNEPAMFSLDRLLMNVVNDGKCNIEIVRQTLPLIRELSGREMEKREKLGTLGEVVREKLPIPEVAKGKKKKFQQGEEGDYECEICRSSLFLSMVFDTVEGITYCLDHAIGMIEKKELDLANCKFMFTYDDDEIRQLPETVKTSLENRLQKKVPNKFAGMPTLLGRLN